VFARRKARRRFERAIEHLPAHEQHLRTLRWLIANGASHGEQLAAARLAYETAPDGEAKQHALRFLHPLQEGRVIHTKSGGKLISILGVPAELVHQVEEALRGVNDETH
jgi:hypothetical protein